VVARPLWAVARISILLLRHPECFEYVAREF